MILLCDIGNTRFKYAPASTASYESVKDASNKVQFNNIFKEMPNPERVIVSSVADQQINNAFSRYAHEHWDVSVTFLQSAASFQGLTNAYKDSVQLGIDRWCAMIAAWTTYQKACVVIDVGTAVTIDMIDDNGQHQGGMIVPGLQLMRESLVEHTAQIDIDLAHNFSQSSCLGRDTQSCVERGIYKAVMHFIESSVTALKKLHPQACVVITGGAVPSLFENTLSDWYYKPDLVLEGVWRQI